MLHVGVCWTSAVSETNAGSSLGNLRSRSSPVLSGNSALRSLLLKTTDGVGHP